MQIQGVLNNLLNPPVLFFFLGMGVVLFKSDLRITDGVSKFLSLYLLFSIGFKGGHELFNSPFEQEHMLTLIACMFMAFFVPIYSFFIFRLKMDHHNASALAGSFGSISAVTFVTAGAFLHSMGLEYQGFIVAGMALMESPAIVIAVILDRLGSSKKNADLKINWKSLLHEAFFSSSVYILIGSLIVGYISGENGWNTTKPFTEDIFKGLLTFFLLDKGIEAAKQMKDLKKTGIFLLVSSIFIMIFNAIIAFILVKIIRMPLGDALMFVVLCASASYIAVPAAMKDSIPEANPSIYITVALSIVFPINIIIGIPLYFYILKEIV
ncbi:sodium-dependent bicarbonate transport family permease [Leptospira ognonensis]|uniref:Sodium-dependent bicarbonate transport family permease n=1 Tax=Leptospira ognonensis TaxID=2484945 RepID=A0A4R9K9X1_9LEPT|nr:sodium-dependent bicarbonate transport family permease [Leptospira ognonensis]TGL62336.1 sodium-dependent bicarbonate transport family permease [Leptospira ognonensis]